MLRPYTEADFCAVHRYAVDPEISQYQAWGPNTEAQTRGFLALCIAENNAEPRTAYHFALVRKEDDMLIGGYTLRIENPGLRQAMIGYSIDRPYWGQGYTTEATRTVLTFAFRTLGLHRITSWCTPENIGSWRVMEKAGLRREGHEQEAVYFKGAWHDWLRYAILDWEWNNASTPT